MAWGAEEPRRVIVEVPATTANLGAGFDVLGLALDLTNEIHLEERDEPGVLVTISGEGADTLPRDESHLAVQAVWRMYDELGHPRPKGIHLHQENRVPLAGGLGSSATAIVGGLLAASELIGVPRDVDHILNVASELEGHPDNVAPALFGGLVTAIRESSNKVCAVSVPINEAWSLAAVLAIPSCVVHTRVARSVLKEYVTLDDAVFNVGRASLFVASAAAGRLDVLSEAMQDRLHQEQRSSLVPGMAQAMQAARDAGALGASLSGAGPTVLALVEPQHADAVGDAMRAAFAEAGLDTRIIQTVPRFDGATVRTAAGRSVR